MSMETTKYEDLAERVWQCVGTVAIDDVRAVLLCLDENPDQVPGRTITQSEMGRKCDLYGDSYLTGFTGAGGRVVPDPEPVPTNAEKIQVEVCLWELQDNPCSLAEWLDRRGVKAGGDDE